MDTTPLTSVKACQKFLETQAPEIIAQRLRHDQKLCRERGLPSVLALLLPPAISEEGGAIALHLSPQNSDVDIPTPIRRLLYTGVAEGIKAYLAQMEHKTSIANTTVNAENTMFDPLAAKKESENMVASKELQTTLRILRGLPETGHVTAESSLQGVMAAVEALLSFHEASRAAPRLASPTFQKCYICRYMNKEPHPLYTSLCQPCGAFNLAEASLSLPGNLDLTGKTAVVTGGRVKLGFHVALRLLRCGASVIVSTRYPYDAESRFYAEPDCKVWMKRLKLVGADFRTARDVFRLIATIKAILCEVESEKASCTDGRLFILVNNAAQTLTDSIEAEEKAIANEQNLQQGIVEMPRAVIDNGYRAAIRGGSLMPGGLLEATHLDGPEIEQGYDHRAIQTPQETSCTKTTNITQHEKMLTTLPSKSSWEQSLEEIPYEDLITAHSVNAFVPLILIRELLPVMDSISSQSPPQSLPCKPAAHILNISAREGIFEASPSSTEKNGRHVHTNMAKAGLNMITETEAARLWKERRIAMNTIDPGYMSAVPDRTSRGDCPLGFDDGAGRVLWPVAVAETEEVGREVVWGRFLKHFGRETTEVGLGR